jgi:hypothetical protein
LLLRIATQEALMDAIVKSDRDHAHADHDTVQVSGVTPAEDARTVLINEVSWGAVLAGVAAAIMTQLLLNMLGIGIGASTLDPVAGDSPTATSFSIGAGIWWAVSSLIAAFIGGYIASRLSGRPNPSTGGWHGLISWSATMLVVFYLLSTAVGGLVGGAFKTVGGALGGLGRTAATAVQTAAPALTNVTDPFASIDQAVRSTGNDPAALRDAASAAMRALVSGNAAEASDARERAAQALAQAQNISIEEARTRVAGYEQQYRQTVAQAKEKATQAADVAAKVVSRGALLGSLALLLGALAAFFGGRLGAVDPTITAGFLGRRVERNAR